VPVCPLEPQLETNALSLGIWVHLHDFEGSSGQCCGIAAMRIYPLAFAKLWYSGPKQPGKKRNLKASGASRAISESFEGKTCHLCCEDDSGPEYDLCQWHVLFECPATTSTPVIVGQRRAIQSYVTDLCDHIFKRRVKGVQRERDLTGMPTELPELPDVQYSLPELVGAMLDSTVLAGDAIRVVADTWCRHALDGRGCTVQVELCAHYVMLPKEPELLRGLRLHWRREFLMSG
jgi:hypothetical protein